MYKERLKPGLEPKKPEVSIILPTFNRVHYIERSIISLLKQVYQDFEIIVVDDGSTDQTAQLVSQIRDHRVQCVQHPQNRGANAARNTGVRLARGNYVAFQDSDDEWLPEKLAVQLSALKAAGEKVRVAFSSFWRINGEKKILIPKAGRRMQSCIKNWHKDLLEGNLITTQALLVERDLLYEAGLFDETLPRFQDWELVLRLSKLTPFLYINQPLFRVYTSPDSISENKGIYYQSIEQVIQKHQESFDAWPYAQILQYFDMATRTLIKERCIKTCINYLKQALNTGTLIDLIIASRMFLKRTFDNFAS
ncbi:MAG: glycosyltransferase family 2 protein [Deltaproteobacteria bacterium]|nr:glycosyltransferase family 2 protein [Deltaproteobacteria bacterium]